MSGLEPTKPSNFAETGGTQPTSSLTPPPPTAAKGQIVAQDILRKMSSLSADECKFAQDALEKINKQNPGFAVECTSTSSATHDSRKKVLEVLWTEGVIVNYGFTGAGKPVVKIQASDQLPPFISTLSWVKKAESEKKTPSPKLPQTTTHTTAMEIVVPATSLSFSSPLSSAPDAKPEPAAKASSPEVTIKTGNFTQPGTYEEKVDEAYKRMLSALEHCRELAEQYLEQNNKLLAIVEADEMQSMIRAEKNIEPKEKEVERAKQAQDQACAKTLKDEFSIKYVTVCLENAKRSLAYNVELYQEKRELFKNLGMKSHLDFLRPHLDAAEKTMRSEIEGMKMVVEMARDEMNRWEQVYQSRPNRTELETACQSAQQEVAEARETLNRESKVWLENPKASRQSLSDAEARFEQANAKLKKANKKLKSAQELMCKAKEDYLGAKATLDKACENLKEHEDSMVKMYSMFDK